MYPITIPSKWQLAARKLFYTGSLAMLAILLFCCVGFICSRHEGLVKWYYSLNSCFYHKAIWSTEFFTPAVKSAGNYYCAIAAILSICGIDYCYKAFRQKKKITAATINVQFADLISALVIIVSACCLWAWGNSQAKPAFDEVFSAQHIAGSHPFQTVSYYMQPNNHLLFNLINNVLFHFTDDKVATGRIISLLAYCKLLALLFFAFYALTKNRWLTLVLCLGLSLQFFVWGFSFQARGYELYLLAEWGMVISLFAYIKTLQKAWLYINVLCCVAGYFCLPSFLYIHAAQLLFYILYQLAYSNRNLLFWKHQFFVFALSFVCYLPTLCFSGIKTITNNSYVAPISKSTTASMFWSNMWPDIERYCSHIFSNISLIGFNPAYLLMFIPLILFFTNKDKTYKLFALFYLCMWISFFLVTTLMKRLPFERNLIGHYSITLAGVFIAVYGVAIAIQRSERANIFRLVGFPLVVILFGYHFFTTNSVMLKDTLYEFNVNEAYSYHEQRLSKIPAGSTVAFSDADFLSLYICKKNGYKTSKCFNGTEDYYVKQQDENLPPGFESDFTLFQKDFGNEIYVRIPEKK